MTPEGRIKEELKVYLKSLGDDCWYFMHVPIGYGKRGVPDFIICYKGFFLAAETKRARGGTSQPWQDREQEAIQKAGGKSKRVTDIHVVREWVAHIDNQRVLMDLHNAL